MKVKAAQLCRLFAPHGLYSPWDSPGQNTGVGSLSLLQGMFPTQRSNPGLRHCRWILYQLSYQGSPILVIPQNIIQYWKWMDWSNTQQYRWMAGTQRHRWIQTNPPLPSPAGARPLQEAVGSCSTFLLWTSIEFTVRTWRFVIHPSPRKFPPASINT